jgi:hypothetical protein
MLLHQGLQQQIHILFTVARGVRPAAARMRGGCVREGRGMLCCVVCVRGALCHGVCLRRQVLQPHANAHSLVRDVGACSGRGAAVTL